jgi:hypothetical protein
MAAPRLATTYAMVEGSKSRWQAMKVNDFVLNDGARLLKALIGSAL